MSVKTYLVLAGMVAIVIVAVFLFKGLGYTFAIAATAGFCWLVPFKTVVNWIAKGLQKLDGKLNPKAEG